MKKSLSLFLGLFLLFGLVGCGKDKVDISKYDFSDYITLKAQGIEEDGTMSINIDRERLVKDNNSLEKVHLLPIVRNVTELAKMKNGDKVIVKYDIICPPYECEQESISEEKTIKVIGLKTQKQAKKEEQQLQKKVENILYKSYDYSTKNAKFKIKNNKVYIALYPSKSQLRYISKMKNNNTIENQKKFKKFMEKNITKVAVNIYKNLKMDIEITMLTNYRVFAISTPYSIKYNFMIDKYKSGSFTNWN